MLKTEPGPKRHQVDIKRPNTSRDNRGQKTGTDTTLFSSVPCSIVTLSGLELIRARKQFADATHRVTMYGDPTNRLTPRDYLVFGSRTLNIGHVGDEDQTGVELVLLCKEDV